MQQPSCVVIDSKIAAELKRGETSLGLADQINRQDPGGERKLLLRRSLAARSPA